MTSLLTEVTQFDTVNDGKVYLHCITQTSEGTLPSQQVAEAIAGNTTLTALCGHILKPPFNNPKATDRCPKCVDMLVFEKAMRS